jgi:hypothetical protein
MQAKQWGPFTGRQLTMIIVAIVVAVAVPVGASAAVKGNPVFLTDANSGNRAGVDTNGNLKVQVAPPNTQFSIPPIQLSIAAAGSDLVKPDPSGTRYLISSFTVTNPTNNTIDIFLRSVASQTTSNGCRLPLNQVSSADGPRLAVGPNSTQTLTFPQPYLIKFVTGPKVCLVAGGNGFIGSTWSAVGYKLLPKT